MARKPRKRSPKAKGSGANKLRLSPKDLELAQGNAETETSPDSGLGSTPVGPNEVCKIAKPQKSGGVIYPSTKVEYHVIMAGEQTFTNEVLEGRELFYIRGCFGYRTFDSEHYSGFCYILDPGLHGAPEKWKFKFCSDGNFAN